MLRFFLIFPKAAARILFSVSQNLTFFAAMKKSQYFCRILIFKIVCVSRILWIFCLFLKETVPVNFIKQILQSHRNLSFYPDIPFVWFRIRWFILFLLIMAARSCIFFSNWILWEVTIPIWSRRIMLFFFFFPICCINHITGIIFIFQSPTQISWILCWLKCTKNSIVNRFIIKICFIIHPVRFLPLWSGSYSARSLFRLPIHFDWCVMIRFILISVIIIQWPPPEKLQSIFISVNLISANCFTKTVLLLPPSFKKSGFSKPEVFWSKATFLFKILQSWLAITIWHISSNCSNVTFRLLLISIEKNTNLQKIFRSRQNHSTISSFLWKWFIFYKNSVFLH